MKKPEFLIDDYAQTPIPEIPTVQGWENVPLTDNDEPLVALSDLSIPSASFYAGAYDFSPYDKGSLAGAMQQVYVREALGEKLRAIQAKLPRTMTLLGLDGLRTPQLQGSLYEYYYSRLEALVPEWSEQMLAQHSQQYVSKPTNDRRHPAPHHTGGALDVWLLILPPDVDCTTINSQTILQVGAWLPAGAPFDHGSRLAAMRYYEEHESQGDNIFRRNRRIGYWIFKAEGIGSLASEYWHKNYGNQMATKAAGGKVAIYGATDLNDEQLQIEQDLNAQNMRNPRRHTTNLPLGEIIQPCFDTLALLQ